MATPREDLEETGRAAIVREIDETASDAYAAATFKEALHELARYARLMIGAHQSALSYVPDGGEVFPKDTILFLEVIDDVALLPVDPAGHSDDEELQRLRKLTHDRRGY